MCHCFFHGHDESDVQTLVMRVSLFFKIQAVGASYVRNLNFMLGTHFAQHSGLSVCVCVCVLSHKHFLKLAGLHRWSLLFILFSALLSGLHGWKRDGQGAFKSQQKDAKRRVRPRQLSPPTNFHRAVAVEAIKCLSFRKTFEVKLCLPWIFPPSWFIINFGCNSFSNVTAFFRFNHWKGRFDAVFVGDAAECQPRQANSWECVWFLQKQANGWAASPSNKSCIENQHMFWCSLSVSCTIWPLWLLWCLSLSMSSLSSTLVPLAVALIFVVLVLVVVVAVFVTGAKQDEV